MNLDGLKGIQFKVYVTMVKMKVSSSPEGRTVIQCLIVSTNQIYGTLTLNIPGIALKDDEILVKTRHENTLIAQEAYATGFFERVTKVAPDTEIWRIK